MEEEEQEEESAAAPAREDESWVGAADQGAIGPTRAYERVWAAAGHTVRSNAISS